MSIASTLPSSTTSPVRMSFDADSTDSRVIRFAAPRSSAAPHLEGQRASGAGGDQVCAAAPTLCKIVTAYKYALRLVLFMSSSVTLLRVQGFGCQARKVTGDLRCNRSAD